ncbi:hypothetical protein QBC42DRAFT_274834 [Cladorrhinum samala]|uniref:Uncharacterized protein n=1 Tax=Cladorrhinum samala TaxID=585594 RepID=A0AAV9HEH2_9PEZI|nr:hypothetical protein QBC42DRAFT_274834 [Cladorrhinum samala]
MGLDETSLEHNSYKLMTPFFGGLSLFYSLTKLNSKQKISNKHQKYKKKYEKNQTGIILLAFCLLPSHLLQKGLFL